MPHCQALLGFGLRSVRLVVFSVGGVSDRRSIGRVWTVQIDYSGVIRGQTGPEF